MLCRSCMRCLPDAVHVPARQNGGGSADGFLSLSSKDAKLINFPGYMIGTWSVKRACAGRWCLQGACPPALEGSIIGGPAETTFAQRFNASTSRRLGDKTAQQMVLEDKGYNLQELWQAQGAAPHRVIANEYSSKLDPTSCRLVLDDGLGEAQPAAAYLFSTARQSEAGEADFILSESLRLILVLSGAIQVLDFEKLERLSPDPTDPRRVTSRQRLAVFSAPDPVQDKIAKARSVGSLRVWGSLTKGAVPAGSLGLNLAGARSPQAVFDYALHYSRLD